MGRFGMSGRRGLTQRSSRRGQRVRGGPCELMEHLEARIVLSDTFYAWTGVETLPGYAAEYGLPDKIIGVSDEGQYFWSSAAAARAGDTDEPYLIGEGRVEYLRDIAALVDAEIAGINSRGMVLAIDSEGDNLGRVFLYDLQSEEGREYLDEAGLDSPLGFDLADATPRFITDGGGLVLTTGADGERRGTQWIVIGSEVTQMWFGVVTDVNSSDWVVGMRGSDSNASSSVLWQPGTGLIKLEEQGVFLDSSGGNTLTADGTILSQSAGGLILWKDGEITPLDIEDQLDQRDWDVKIYYPAGRSATGILGVSEYWSHDAGHGTGEEMFVVHPDRDVYIQAVDKQDYKFLAMTESGIMLIERKVDTFDDVPGGWFDVIDESRFLAVSPEEYATVWMENGELAVLTRTANGQRLQFELEQGGSVVSSFAGLMGFNASPWMRETIMDPATGKVLVFGLFRGEFRVINPGSPHDVPDTYTQAYDKITSGVTGFFDSNSRPVIAGLDKNARLLLAYGAPSGDSYITAITNLSLDHLGARGLETPQFAGGLEAFRTQWGAMNIVGLDTSGDVQAVWWSPGLGSPLWTTSNLSAITGAPKLVGELTAAATPWGGMQVMGTDEQGHVVSLWWSPKTGRWQVTDLPAQVDGPTLDAGSLSVQTGRWGSITLVGTSTEGDVVTYWWSPAGGWRVESLTEQAGSDTPQIAGNISYFAAPTGEQHVAGVTAAGHVIDLFWKPDGNGWQWQDLTALAMG